MENTQDVEQHHDGSSRLIDQNNPDNATSGQARGMGYDNSLAPRTSSLPMSVFDLPDFMSTFERRDFEMQEPPGDNTRQMIGPMTEGQPSLENISSFSENTFPRNMGAWGYPLRNTPVRSIPKSVTKEHYELYLDLFHHRWPIIHIPSFEKGDEPYVLTASVEMIGAWLQGTCPSKLVALTLHDRLINHIFQRMV